MKQTNKSDRFRQYLNRALLVFWVLLLALVVRACNQPAHADTEQAIQTTPTIWETDPIAGVVLEPVTEGIEQ
ncbi:PTS sugar transporter subunit IID [Neisseria sp. HMSC068C04]|uniref:PTS sugar transporter subunit IID n=1 Tax=Neisseria sp. HMSC068C04 TaxID=1715179 RepID=UPI0008A5C6CB|nr:PTS sugar transporter subunit IID [Neisseria sp. HMSC068C04]OFM29056.1 PTS sugar transporter subunit IID [Neisseria sp. HMSC068C04]